MSKRFHDTEIWDKPWFTELSPPDKLAFMYIKDKCDAVGVWVPNVKIAEVYMGTKPDWKSLPKRSNGNVIILQNGKWWIPDFCEFQYGEFSEECRPHQSYIKLLKKHGLYENVIKGYAKGKLRVSETSDTHKEKEKEKDIEKDKEKENAKARAQSGNTIPQKAQELLEYYKKLTGKTRLEDIPKEVTARLRKGASVEDGKKVILYKYLCWWNDEKTRPWVNLTTLFRPSHFEEYLSQAEQELEQMLLKAYKDFQKKFFDANMDKPLEERKKLKVPTFDEFKKDYSFTESRMNSPP